MLDTLPYLRQSSFPALIRAGVEILQVNLGYRCNQQCVHCHVNAGPKRTEQMSLQTMQTVLDFIDAHKIKTLDLTGGAPELNENFRYLIAQATARGVKVMDRCNLTVLLEPGMEGLAEFMVEHKVEVVSSLPCYLEENVDGQRGKGVYQKSIAALKMLNRLGYAQEGSELILNLVYNPTGPFLPPPQKALEQDYRHRLFDEYGIKFNHLYSLANMPIARFGSSLLSKNGFDDYMNLLRNAHQDSNLESVMCRDLISVDWQGYVYDCDFNQMLKLPLSLKDSVKPKYHLSDLYEVDLSGQPIAVMEHCYGCTAGQGSSCGGALLD
ncbi:MAG: arsenosugar biosynthesis radical SAM protein ArsS [Gammaproteobacteria bacterium]|nr:arsenosugar biosynthesis radical SAM protein ArsS [Gammaproteobacteria bacterium]